MVWSYRLLPAALAAALYRFAPGLVYDAAMGLARRVAGLRRAQVVVDGHRISYLDGGRGEPMLLLHGFGANKDQMQEMGHLPMVERPADVAAALQRFRAGSLAAHARL